MKCPAKTRAVNSLHVCIGTAIVALVMLGWLLIDMSSPTAPGPPDGTQLPGGTGASATLFVHCAAGCRRPVEKIAAEYEREQGVSVRLQFGGSNTLLSQIEVSRIGDLYLAADDIYMKQAQDRGLVKETLPVAISRPVIAVKKGNAKSIATADDLLREDVRVALGNPDQAAIGNTTRNVLQASGHWERLEKHVTDHGAFLPTVPEVANSVLVGGVDAGIIWDSTAAQYPALEAIRVPQLDAGAASIMMGVLTSTRMPTQALRFARYLAAQDKGLEVFRTMRFEPVHGDTWQETPELTFFCGTVNRRAVESVIKAFEEREGVRVNTIYNGCGSLTAQMRTINGQQQGFGFPDTYMACDVYYLNTVKDWFQEAVNVSDTEIVIAVPKGNPQKITSLKDLTRAGVRISVGQPDQCTIGVLTKQLLEKEGILDAVMKNVQTQTVTSAMLVPTVTTGAVDATLAYVTDTLAESKRVDVIRIPSTAAKAIQPFSIARTSHQKHLARRLYRAVAASRTQFEAAGFHWRLATPKDSED